MAGTRPSGRVGKIVVRVSRKPQPCPSMPRFSKPLILLALAAAIAAALGAAQPAQARSMSTCSKALIHDWYVDGRVDKTYPVHCYREALKQIPEDQVIYGTLRQDLTRALQSAIRQHGGNVTGDTLVVPLRRRGAAAAMARTAQAPRQRRGLPLARDRSSGRARPTRFRSHCSSSVASPSL